jgi:predicted HTH transcriptional regulator
MSSILPVNINDLLHHRGVESARVELKRSWDERTTGPQVLRTICAFANDLQNLNGGYIVLGVAEERGVAQLPPAGLGAHIPPVSARNRRIGELLKELRLAEARGTGLTKIYRAMRLNGSPAPRFDFDATRSYFRITLPIHPGSLGIEALRNAAQLQALGDPESAQEILQQAREALAETLRAPAEASQAWTWFSLGQVLRGLKASPEEIRRAFEQASQLMPDEDRFRREIEKR